MLQFLAHGGKVDDVTADAVDLPDQQVRELTGTNTIHHRLIVRPVCVLGRVAGVGEHDVVVDAENHLAVRNQLALLHFQRVLVDLPVGRNANVYRHLEGG